MSKKILVIDDEELLTKTFSRLLEKNGCEVLVARNGQDALAMCEEEDFDLIICDIRMPGKDGVQTIKTIKDLMVSRGKKESPVIFVTGYADEQIEMEAKKLKPLAYLFKPFDAQELVRIVQGAK